ncbi:MAG: four helix bundle protein [Desertifilum sp. SIO1I2]|nr:four helix bundle protein [Desertifilum sp. SIO1I2]
MSSNKVEKFEDLIAWQKARLLTQEIYQTTRQGEFSRDFGLTGQMQRASVSIMSNIAEGFERRRPSEFLYFLSIAKSSCAEVRSQLYIALDVGYISQNQFNQLFSQSQEVAKILGGLRASIEKQL